MHWQLAPLYYCLCVVQVKWTLYTRFSKSFLFNEGCKSGPKLSLEASIWPGRRVYHRVWVSRGYSCCLDTRTGWAGNQTADSCTGASWWQRGPWHRLLEQNLNWHWKWLIHLLVYLDSCGHNKFSLFDWRYLHWAGLCRRVDCTTGGTWRTHLTGICCLK